MSKQYEKRDCCSLYLLFRKTLQIPKMSGTLTLKWSSILMRLSMERLALSPSNPMQLFIPIDRAVMLKGRKSWPQKWQHLSPPTTGLWRLETRRFASRSTEARHCHTQGRSLARLYTDSPEPESPSSTAITAAATSSWVTPSTATPPSPQSSHSKSSPEETILT